MSTESRASDSDIGAIRHEIDGPQESLAACTADGRWVQLHSRRDPSFEADRLVAPLFDGPAAPSIVLVIGAGLGYAIDAIERRSLTTRVIVLEPFASAARAMRARRARAGLPEPSHVRVLEGPEYHGSADAWRLVGAEPAPPVLVHPVLKGQFPAEVARAERVARRIVEGAAANEEARRRFAGPYLLNTLGNLPTLWREADAADLFGALPGVPAVVVGAGPSLDAAIEPLRRVQNRVVIVAVDTALRPLLAAGIQPHLVVAVDPQEANARHLRGVTGTEHVWLVTEGSLPASAFDPFPGRTFVFQVSDHHPWPWLRAHGSDRGKVRAWGSVLTSAFDLALKIGSDRIALVGADLSYPGSELYCRNTIYERDWARFETPEARQAAFRKRLALLQTVDEPDVNGTPVVSTPQFLQFRDWIASAAAEAAGVRVVNAGGAGILRGAAIEQQTPDALDALAGPPRDVRPAIALAWGRSAEARAKGRARFLEAAGSDALDAPVDTWVTFGAGGTTADEIRRRLALVAADVVVDVARAEGWREELTIEPARPGDDGYFFLRADSIVAPVENSERHALAPSADSPVPAEHVSAWWQRSPLAQPGVLRARMPHLARHLAPFLRAATRPPSAIAGTQDAVIRLTHVGANGAISSAALDTISLSTARLLRLATGLLFVVEPRAGASASPGGPRSIAPLVPSSIPLGTAFTRRGGRLEVNLVPGAASCAQMRLAGAVGPSVIANQGLVGQPVALDDATVAVTRLHQDRVLLVDADGTVTSGERWPGPVRGVVFRRRDGGSVAWADGKADPKRPGEPCAWWRERRGGPVRAMRLPFRPGAGLDLGDGRVAWTCLDGGIACVSPDGWLATAGASRLLSGPVLVGTEVMTSEMTLTGVQVTPVAPANAVVWDTMSDVLRPGPALGVHGPISSRATRGRWTADCHFLASVVRLTRDDGVTVDMVCHEPNRAAWAGDTLVVGVLGWDVLIFRHLVQALEAVLA